jgi:hypothetical protein
MVVYSMRYPQRAVLQKLKFGCAEVARKMQNAALLI